MAYHFVVPSHETADHDIRKDSQNVKYDETDPGKKKQKRDGQVKRVYRSPRDIGKVVGITLHQVDVNNVGRGAYRKMSAHYAVHHDGEVYWIHPATTLVIHAHGLNRDTIGIEVAGKFALDTPLPPAQALGLQRAIRIACAEVEGLGGRITHIWAHRQSSKKRARDPGRAIYQAGVLWAMEELELEHDPGETRGKGLRIPAEWELEPVDRPG